MRKVTITAIISAAIVLGLTTLVIASGGEAGHADSDVLLQDFIYRCINFAVTVGILAFFIMKPAKKALADRRENISKTLEEAKTVKAEAEAKYQEIDEKLKTADEKIDKIYSAIRHEGEVERQKILAEAQVMAEKIESEAKKSAAREVERARLELRGEAATLALQLAEQMISKNIKPEDHDRLLNEYLRNVGELH